MHCNGPGHGVLSGVKPICVPASMNTLFFKLHTAVLPVQVWMWNSGMFRTWSLNCFHCKKSDAFEHAFLYSGDAVSFWIIFKRTLEKELYITPYSIRTFLVIDRKSVV